LPPERERAILLAESLISTIRHRTALVLGVERVEGVRPDIKKALSEMSWEERLELARSQREAILQSRGPETAPKQNNFSKRKVPDVGDLEPTTLVDETSEEDMKRAISAAVAYKAPFYKKPFAERFMYSRRVFIGMAFLAGIGMGALSILVAGVVLDRAPTSLASAPASQSGEIGPAFDIPVVAARSPAQPALAPAPPEGPTVTSVLGTELSLTIEPVSGALPGISSKARRDYVKYAAFFAHDADRLPSVGEPLSLGTQAVASAVADQLPNDPPEIVASLSSSLTSGPDAESSGFAMAALEAPQTDAEANALLTMSSDALPVVEGAPEPLVQWAGAPVVMRSAPPQRPFNLDPADTTVDQVRLVAAGSDVTSRSAARLTQSDDLRRLVLADTVESDGLPIIPVSLRSEVIVRASAPLDFAAPDRVSIGTGFQVAALGSELFARDVPSRLPLEFALIEPPATDLAPPKPILPGAEGLSVSIFAASTVEDEDVEAAQGIVDVYDLPVRTVTRVGYRISQNQVRFYDATSAEAAERLAAEIGAISRDFTNSNASPPPGTLEVYLAGDAAPSSAPVRRQPSEAERLRNSVISKLRSGVFN